MLCLPAHACRRLLLLPKQLLHGANVNLVLLLLPHRQRPDVGLSAHLLLRYRLPEEAADTALLPRVVVGGRGRGGQRGCPWRRGRQGRRWGSLMFRGVGGITEGGRAAVCLSGHRGRIGGGGGERCGAATPLAAAALWLIGCGWTTHNQHHKKEPSAYELYAERVHKLIQLVSPIVFLK